MATLTLSLASTPFTGSKSYTLSDADVTRWLAAIQQWQKDKLGDTPTNAQTLVAWADDVVANAKRLVRSVETATASQTITDIGVT